VSVEKKRAEKELPKKEVPDRHGNAYTHAARVFPEASGRSKRLPGQISAGGSARPQWEGVGR